MRSIWNGDLSFGLVNVPVKAYSATESHDRRSHQVDSKDGTRIRYKRVREGTDTEVEFANIANAYESDDGQTVILTKEDLSTLPVTRSPEISILEFVPVEQVDPIYFDKPYYLEPSSKSPKAYVLLAKALETTDRLAIATFTLRNRTRLAALRVVDGVMTLQTLLWPDEVRKPDFGFLDAGVEVRDQELEMAKSLIETMANDFDPDDYSDTYTEELGKLIESRAGGAPAFADTAPQTPADDDGEVADLLAALRASVKDRTGGELPAAKAPAKKAHTRGAPPPVAPPKEPTAKKAPAKKVAAKKTPAKKAAAKKAAS